MKKYILLIASIIPFILLSGCTASSPSKASVEKDTQGGINYKRYYKQYNGYDNDIKNEAMINYKLLANDAVRQIFKNKDIPKIIVVTDFVDLSSLQNQSVLGYILSNSVKDSLINIHNANVIESEVSKYFKLSSNGLRLLTRDIDKVKTTKYMVEEAIVGTYTYTKNELIVFVKLINLKTGLIKGSYTNSMLIGKDTMLSKSYKSK
jgi:TolB-like protein